MAIVLGIATLGSASPLLLSLAALDIGLATTDLLVAVSEDALMKTEEGREFLENWNKVSLYLGIATAGPLIINAFRRTFVLGAKLLSKATLESTQKFLRTAILKLVLEINIANFSKNTIKLIPYNEVSKILKISPLNASKLQKIGVIFAEGEIQIAKKTNKGVAALYKGEVIASGTAKEVQSTIRQLAKLKGEKLLSKLEEVVEVAINTRLRKAALLKWAKKFDENSINHILGDVSLISKEIFNLKWLQYEEWIYLGTKGQGGHLINEFIEIIEITHPKGINNIANLLDDIPFKAKINIKSALGKKFPKDAISSMFPKNWSLERIKEEIAFVYENTVAKEKGFKKTINGISNFEGLSTNGFEIRIQIKGGIIINGHPINF